MHVANVIMRIPFTKSLRDFFSISTFNFGVNQRTTKLAHWIFEPSYFVSFTLTIQWHVLVRISIRAKEMLLGFYRSLRKLCNFQNSLNSNKVHGPYRNWLKIVWTYYSKCSNDFNKFHWWISHHSVQINEPSDREYTIWFTMNILNKSNVIKVHAQLMHISNVEKCRRFSNCSLQRMQTDEFVFDEGKFAV